MEKNHFDSLPLLNIGKHILKDLNRLGYVVPYRYSINLVIHL